MDQIENCTNSRPFEAFDFQEWAKLAQTDPTAFEQRRQGIIDQVIDQAPEETQHRLRQFQFRIDLERQRAKTPLAACIRLSSMMWDMMLGPNGLAQNVEDLPRILNGQPTRQRPKAEKADILPFTSQKAGN